MKPARDTWINPALALTLCAAAGALCAWLVTPLPWMIGPMVAMAALNFAGARLRAPAGGRQIGQIIIGVALAQSLRILVVVVAVPFALTYSGVHGMDAYRPAAAALDPAKLALLLAIAAGAGGALGMARAPNAVMLGPLFTTIALTASEVQFSALPGPLSNAGQLLLGCALGSRFEQQFLSRLPRYVAAVLASIGLALIVATAFGATLAWLTGLSVPTLVLATAPGGIAEMCITAKVLRLGVPLVTAAHVARVIVLVTL